MNTFSGLVSEIGMAGHLPGSTNKPTGVPVLPRVRGHGTQEVAAPVSFLSHASHRSFMAW